MITLKVTFGFPQSTVTYDFDHRFATDNAWLSMPLESIEFHQEYAHQIALALCHMGIENVKERFELARIEGRVSPTSTAANGDMKCEVTFAELMSFK